MKDIIIIGASGFGKEVLWLAKRLNRNVIGFLDDTPEKQNTELFGCRVIGKINEFTKFNDMEFVIAIGSPRCREQVFKKMIENGSPQFATLIDPTVVIGENIIIGSGSLICAGVILTVDIRIGEQVVINLNSTIGHDVVIENFVTIAPNVSISGNVSLANKVEVGTNASIKEKITVDQGAMIGMGSVVTKNVEKNKLILGNPARAIKTLD
jgi:sugar O-acyltransferase (sialic acid O-acetyltransferase NeuD family)